MKKIALMLAVLIATALAAHAVPASPQKIQYTQPDGSQLTLQLVGDEFYHFNTTADGYTVMRGADGGYYYARQHGGEVVAGTLLAHDARQRTAAEAQLLQATPKRLTSQAAIAASKQQRARRDMLMQPAQRKAPSENYRGLVILVQYNDIQFIRSDAAELYAGMVGQENYTGYTNEDGSYNYYGNLYIGSVRDYFRDNSNGMFNPEFDVVGPITVDYNSTDHQSTNYSYAIFNDALALADSLVDYSQYDSDGDGRVDMVYFISAGHGANYSGNNGDLLWPHASSLYWVADRDGVGFGRYACSVELYGWEGRDNNILDGIGTICHEFSHVLGLPDLYDTDYSGSGGQSNDPGNWSVMSGGSYNQFGRVPTGWGAYERITGGYLQPGNIDAEDTYSLASLQSNNEALVMRTSVDGEFFLLENRQQERWDRYLPGQGMLVFHVDSTMTEMWNRNRVNADPSHNCFLLLRAGGGNGSASSDPFPGTDNVNFLSNVSTPNLQLWNGGFSDFSFTAITETDGVVTFNAVSDNSVVKVVETFEHMPVTGGTSDKAVRGNFASWNMTRCQVAADSTGRSIAMRNPSVLETATPLNFNPYLITATLTNYSGASGLVKLSYSTDDGASWTNVPTNASVEFEAGNEQGVQTSLSWTMPITAVPTRYRLSMTRGNSRLNMRLDDVTFSYTSPVTGDVNLDSVADASDITALTGVMLGNLPAYATLHDVNGDGVVDAADITSATSAILGQ